MIRKNRGGAGYGSRKVDRFWEVDAARGVAIIMMIVYHTTYDLDTLGGYDVQSTYGVLGALRRLDSRPLSVSSRRLARHQQGEDEPDGLALLRQVPGEGSEDSGVREWC